MLRRRLGHKEHGLDVQIHHVIPVFLAEFKGILTTNQTGVVDQNIDMTEFGNRTLKQLRNTVNLAQIGGQAQETTSQRGNTLNRFHRLNNINADNIAARFGQTERHTLTQPGITAGDNSHFTL